MPRLALPARLTRFFRESEGNAAVEFALISPLLLLVAIGAMYLLSLFSVYNTLYSATYRAARLLSVEGYYIEGWGRGGQAQTAVDRFIKDEIREQQTNNIWRTMGEWNVETVLVSGGVVGAKPSVCAGTSEDEPHSIGSVEFSVVSRLVITLNSDTALPLIKDILPQGQSFQLMSQHTSFLECGQTELKR